MPKRIQAPDGSVVEFPDNMSDVQIEAAMRRNYPPSRPAPTSERGKPSLYLDRPAPRANVNADAPQAMRGQLPLVRPSRPSRGPGSRPSPDDRGRRATRDRPGLAPRLPTVQGPLTPLQQIGSSIASLEGGFRPSVAAMADMAVSQTIPSLGLAFGPDALQRAVTDAPNEYVPLNAVDRLAAGVGRNIPNAAMPGGAVARGLSVLGPAIGGESFRSVADMAGADETGQALAEFGGNIVGSLPSAVMAAPDAARAAVTRARVPRVRSGPPTRGDSVRLLREAGVDMTPGDRIGGPVRSLEDALQSAPVMGPMIRSARSRGINSFNAAMVQDTLQPIGGRISDQVGIGGEMVADAQRQIGAHLDEAAAAIPQITPTREFAEGIWSVREGLPPRLQTKFDEVLNTYLDPNALNSGAMTGAQLRQVESLVNEASRNGRRATSMDDNRIGEALGEAVGHIKGLLEANAAPEVADALRNGRLAWAKMVRVLEASRRSHGAPFSPSQFAGAVAAKESRRDNIGRGSGLMQDYSRAAKEVFGNRMPDSGTSDRWGLGALGVLYGNDIMRGQVPVAGLATTATLGALGSPYTMMARNILARVPKTASATEARRAAEELAALAAQAPPDQAAQILALKDNLLRLSAAGAIALSTPGSASADQGPPRQ